MYSIIHKKRSNKTIEKSAPILSVLKVFPKCPTNLLRMSKCGSPKLPSVKTLKKKKRKRETWDHVSFADILVDTYISTFKQAYKNVFFS